MRGCWRQSDFSLARHYGQEGFIRFVEGGAAIGNRFHAGEWDAAVARADHARTQGGAGLGLSIVLAIAEAHGGSAHASNRDQGGADVWLVMPAT